MTNEKIRIDTSGGPSAKFWKIYLGDMDITRFVRNISIKAGVKYIILVVNIEVIGYFDLPTELEAKVTIKKASLK